MSVQTVGQTPVIRNSEQMVTSEGTRPVGAEQRLNEFNALLEVVQQEAESMFVATASTVRGVRTGAAALHHEDETDDADDASGLASEEFHDGYDDPDATEAGTTRPRVRPRQRNWP